MCQYSAEEGVPGPWHAQHYGAFAASGPGLIVIEATGVLPEGRISSNCLGLYNDAQEAAFTELVRNMKTFGNSKISIQIGHAGRRASTNELWKGARPLTQEEGAWTCYAPSAIPYDTEYPTPVELDTEGIAKIKEGFVNTARRCLNVGFDTIELHFAHGYLAHEFLSPITNKRTDQYGGSLENRMRLPLEIIEAVRSVWPEEKPLGMRISATEWVESESFTTEEAVTFVSEAKRRGIDYVCVSTGGNISKAKMPLEPGFQVPIAKIIRDRTGVIVRAVGLIVTGEQAEKVLADECADFVAIGRAFLNDPRWTWHAAKELGVSFTNTPQYKFCQAGFWRMSDVANPPKEAVAKS